MQTNRILTQNELNYSNLKNIWKQLFWLFKGYQKHKLNPIFTVEKDITSVFTNLTVVNLAPIMIP